MGTDENTPWEDLPKKATDALLYGLGDQKVRVDYVTVDGRETYWYIEWEGALAAVQRRYQDCLLYTSGTRVMLAFPHDRRRMDDQV